MKRFTNPYNRTDDGVWTKYILLIIIICRWVSSSLAVLLTESENKIENRHNRQNATNIGHKGFWKSQPAVNTCRWFETKDSIKVVVFLTENVHLSELKKSILQPQTSLLNKEESRTWSTATLRDRSKPVPASQSKRSGSFHYKLINWTVA